MARLQKNLILCFKIALTGLVLLVFTARAQRSYRELSAQLRGPVSLDGLLKASPDKIRAATQTKNVNQLIPDFSYLLRVNAGQEPLKAEGMYPYIRYYQAVVAYAPQLAEAYGILGFCYYQEGQVGDAVAAYQNAIRLNPYFFWFHYNLGTIYFQQQHYALADRSFKNALSTQPDIALGIISASKIYQQVGTGIPDFREKISLGIKAGFDTSLAALATIQRYDLINHPVLFPMEALQLKIF